MFAGDYPADENAKLEFLFRNKRAATNMPKSFHIPEITIFFGKFSLKNRLN